MDKQTPQVSGNCPLLTPTYANKTADADVQIQKLVQWHKFGRQHRHKPCPKYFVITDISVSIKLDDLCSSKVGVLAQKLAK